ncbi:MAG: RNA polymerase sigma factor [Rhodanobacteraceae bacterium]
MAASKQRRVLEEPRVGVLGGRAFASTGPFDRFVREQYRGLLQFLQVRTANRQDAEEVAQESIVKLLRYQFSKPVGEWRLLLYRIAVNAAHDKFREAQHRHADQQVAFDDQVVVAQGDSPEAFAARQQALEQVRGALLQLPSKCQRVCLLRLARGMTNAEIAKHCGISIKMVEKHLAKGLGTMRKRVGDLSVGAF